MNDVCLCCGKKLEKGEVDWHKKCIKKFFGIESLPIINVEEFSNLFLDSPKNQSIVPGVQKKISLHLKKEGKTSRLTIVDYPSGYILKPISNQYENLPENEWLTMHLANLCKVETVPFALIRLNNNSLAYITKRIDREGKNKIPMEDFCQLGGNLTEDKYHSSYEQVGKILSKYSSNIGLDYFKLFDIILFSFIVGNSDMHLKNFSIYKKNGKYILSPAYDLLNTIILTNDLEELALTLEGKKSNLKKENFINLAKKYELSNTQIRNIFNQYEKNYDKIINKINTSFLDDAMKRSYINLVKKRFNQLAFINFQQKFN
ncbi:MAG: HipA domain-containing protein [Sphaerochaetaceae bacterium]